MRTEQVRFPEGYGTPSELMAWEDVRQRLVEAKQFWFAFERPGRSPHVTPLDGIWFEDKLVYGGSPETLHRRLAAEHPKVTVNLPDPWKLVVIEGEVRTTTFDAATAEEIAGLLNAKYPEYGENVFEAKHYVEGTTAVHPRRIRAWTSFPKDATAFVFD
ncbi:pyridoxamine 5'-phosphate oxidase family protein [Nocardioides sp. NPDC127503]|uniref:pyridoxamine 5'-phosphate oxidase family protein n=1 Tax=Nocardioides sp. NPDC127503 TaxID=3154516 RepID=UPI0033290145